jgi:hypothetical protein
MSRQQQEDAFFRWFNNKVQQGEYDDYIESPREKKQLISNIHQHNSDGISEGLLAIAQSEYDLRDYYGTSQKNNMQPSNMNMQAYHNINKENDNTYVTISFTNQNLIDDGFNTQEQTLEYNVTKTIPFLDNASEYYCAITRFDIPLTTIPITIMPIQPNQPNPNLSTLQIGITIGTATPSFPGMQFLIYVPQNLTRVPVQNNPNSQVITPYYFIFNYEQMIQMLNVALQAGFTGAGLVGTAPYFIYNPVTQLISLIVGSQFNTDPLVGPQIIINYALFQYLNAFDFTGLGNGFYRFNVFGLVNESYAYYPNGQIPPAPVAFPAITAPNFYKISQEFVYLGGWNPLRKILFLTNNIPIKKEVVPCNDPNSNNSGVFSSLPVLAEFTPLVDGTVAGQQREIAYYTTNGNYGLRLVDMTTPLALSKLDIKVFWQDIANNLYSMTIADFQQANITIGFIRKSLYKHY